ncbi:extracellular solute-binding protein [Marinobacterium rhizophilum]|uniref:Extracellular solute-binding protein n=1 Tax=Marinobacterium rhizophilum TaxID=420402 RepID=A0ABY5HLJ3_9GAMM|nr:extracellular solute-binding protein [Marinobacterium rhizophilum]UTW13180.1 extracellular solute-binding protein [Marinobacterium rhizophilum]
MTIEKKTAVSKQIVLNSTQGPDDVAGPRQRLSRRSVLKGMATTSVISCIGGLAPAIISPQARASSGELNILSWPDYIWPDMIRSFEAKTGIRVRLSTYGDNNDALGRLTAERGKGFDLIFPSVTSAGHYYSLDLLQPLAENRLALGNIAPTMLASSLELGATHGGKRYLLPFAWGTEAITLDSARHDDPDGELSYLDLWQPENPGPVTLRPSSALIALGLALDYNGELPSDRMADAYRSEEKYRQILDRATAFAINHKQNIRSYWHSTPEILSAFAQEGCAIGQTWDGPGLTLFRQSKGRYRYRMPREGGLAWLDPVGISAGAGNLEQAYAFINHLLTPEVGAMMANQSGYNSCVAGTEAYLLPDVREAYNATYTREALDNLWWWQVDPPYWLAVRQEYVKRFMQA